ELISSFINFGALIAFTFVNLSVIAYFIFRQKRYKTGKDLFSYLVMPILGAASTGILWANLQADALIGGIVWVIIGFFYLLFQTKFFKIKTADFAFEDADRNTSL
ncbi:Putrescine importer PuuP, partial [Neobacillus mesonae]|nr:Putrescine importer PuuP [Neobacillus mesonae]